MILNPGDFVSQPGGHVAMSRDIWLLQLGGISDLEVPYKIQGSPTARNCLIQNYDRADLKNPDPEFYHFSKVCEGKKTFWELIGFGDKN